MNAKVVKKEGNFTTVTKKPFINPAKLQAKSASNADKIQWNPACKLVAATSVDNPIIAPRLKSISRADRTKHVNIAIIAIGALCIKTFNRLFVVKNPSFLSKIENEMKTVKSAK
jgi:hypothetical protein